MEFIDEDRPRSAGSPASKGKGKGKEVVRNLTHKFTLGKTLMVIYNI